MTVKSDNTLYIYSCVKPPSIVEPKLRHWYSQIRPISLLPLPARLLEKIVVTSLKHDLISHFGPQQFGYRPKSSTLSALVSVHEHLTRYLDAPNTSGAMVIAYDYSKAFDRLSGELIISRLTSCEFPSQFISWIYNYLSNRYQYVRIGDVQSCRVPVTSGVPQGSVLGPYLFAIATGDYSHDAAFCHLAKYADDTTLCFPIFKAPATNQHVSQEHKKLLDWSERMHLTINSRKCKAIIVKKSMHCEDIDLPGVSLVSSLKILGVTFDSCAASWSLHFDSVIKSASQRFYALRLLRPSLTNSELTVVYNATLRSVLEYCALLFVGMKTKDADRLERIQRRFHRLVCGSDCVSEDCVEPLADRRWAQAMKFLQKIRTDPDNILRNVLPASSSSGRFILPGRRTTRRSRSFFLFTCERWNQTFQR